MAKYRFMKEVNIDEREVYFTEKRFLFFFWIYVGGSISRDVDIAFKYFEKVLRGEKALIIQIK